MGKIINAQYRKISCVSLLGGNSSTWETQGLKWGVMRNNAEQVGPVKLTRSIRGAGLLVYLFLVCLTASVTLSGCVAWSDWALSVSGVINRSCLEGRKKTTNIVGMIVSLSGAQMQMDSALLCALAWGCGNSSCRRLILNV